MWSSSTSVQNLGRAVKPAVEVMGLGLVLGDGLWLALASHFLGRQNLLCYISGLFSPQLCPVCSVLPHLKSEGRMGFNSAFDR